MTYLIRLATNAVLVAFFASMLAVAYLDNNTFGMIASAGGILAGMIGAINASHQHHSATVLRQRISYHTGRADYAEAELRRLRMRYPAR